MTRPDAAELQRWSEEVARDPASMSFLPLARAYRRQGRRDAALRLCLRGLERHPTHVGAHALLALLYLESGDRELASDEWSTVLRLEPENFDAHRGLGFVALEREDWSRARHHLERASELRPGDPAIEGALRLLAEREAAMNTPPDPSRLFAALEDEPGFRGALVLDAQGLVLAGSLDVDASRADEFGARLGAATAETLRMVRELGLGGWRGVTLESGDTTLRVVPLDEGTVTAVVARRDAPIGWIRHATDRAAALGRTFMRSAR